MRKISLQQIRAFNPCTEGWRRLIKGLGKSEADDSLEITIHDILRINGLDDALWCLRVWPEYASKWRMLAVRYARQVQYLMTDKCSVDAIDVAERHANGAAAGAAAWAAARERQGELLIEMIREIEAEAITAGDDKGERR